MTAHTLSPLAYHRAVVDHLRKAEPEVWAWSSSVKAQQEHIESVRAELLRNTYRLTSQSHPAVQAIAELAAQRLGLSIPVTLYQGGDGSMNASLFFIPGEAHVIFSGPVLERLSESELIALMGHELAHYVLWTAENGAFHAADRILSQTAFDPTSASSHYETARRYALYTEIFADRGAAIAAESAHPAITLLVKTQTGLATVDAESYLSQSKEIESSDKAPTEEHSHPESFIRAQAIDRWWQQQADVDAWLSQRIEGPLVMERLDLISQGRLQTISRGFVARLLKEPRFSSELAQIQAREYFPDWSESETPIHLADLQSSAVGETVKDFLCAVLLDFTFVDPDVREEALPDAGRLAVAIGAEKNLLVALKKHLGMAKRPLDKLAKQWLRDGAAL